MSAVIVQQAMFAFLSGQGEGDVYGMVARRVYPTGEVPQKVEYPYIQYQVTTVEDAPSLTSQGETTDTSTFRFFCTAKSADGAALLARALKRRLNGSRFNVDAVQVQGAQRVAQADFHDSETGEFQTIADYMVTAKYV